MPSVTVMAKVTGTTFVCLFMDLSLTHSVSFEQAIFTDGYCEGIASDTGHDGPVGHGCRWHTSWYVLDDGDIEGLLEVERVGNACSDDNLRRQNKYFLSNS